VLQQVLPPNRHLTPSTSYTPTLTRI